jgi:hypothetical protein
MRGYGEGSKTVMKDEKKLRYSAALFELNPSTALCGGKGKKEAGKDFIQAKVFI